MLRPLLLSAITALVACQEFTPIPKFSLLDPQGVRMAIDDEPGVQLVAYHYSINKFIADTNPGDWNVDVNQPTDGEWVHENREIVVNEGDIVHYWNYVLHNGLGYQRLEQSWVATRSTLPPGPSTTPTTTSTQPTTTTTTAAPTPPPPSTTQGPSTTRGPTNPPGPTTPRPTLVDCEDTYPCLIFEDNFDELNLDDWQHEITAGGGGNWEFQYYTNNRSNSYVKNGNLYIKPTLTEDTFGPGFVTSGNLEIWGGSPANLCTSNQWYGCQRAGNPNNPINPAQSARLRTVNSFSVKYGKIEVEAKMPKGDWLWPAIWMLPKTNGYGDWPSSGEIDLVESRGNLDLRNEQGTLKGHQEMGATMHWGPFFAANKYALTNVHRSGDFGDSFHKYGVEWDENSIQFFLDDEMILNVDPGSGGFWVYGNLHNEYPDDINPWKYGTKMAPFDQEFYMIMNVAVGGTNGFFPDTWTNAGYPKPWTNPSSTAFRDFWNARDSWYPTWQGEDCAMQVNYVRVWKLKA